MVKTMIEFNNHQSVIKELETVQGNEKDERDKARDCQLFVTKKDGQWEERIWSKWGQLRRPRYTYDKTTPIIDAIVGEMEQNEFAAVVNPASGAATKENAELLDGMVRSIQNWSDASSIYKKIARKLTYTGFDCCRVVHDYKNEDTFDQDLIIKYIPNSIDRVWFDPAAEEPDRSDANWVIVLQALTEDQYWEKFPNGSGRSVSENRQYDAYYEKRETIIVGEILYKKKEKRTLVLMSNGKVYDKEDSQQAIDELASIGVTVVRERQRDDIVVHSRKFDGDDWLTEEQETAFSLLPICPFYHGFDIVEDKITWRRIVEKAINPQRILNYSISRQIEEGALAPREKIMATEKQMEGHAKQWAALNTSADPVLTYNVDKDAPQPYKIAGPSINPALAQSALDAEKNIEAVMGMYAANLAQNPSNQSGVAIELQQAKGDTGNVSFYVDIARGITYICEVLLDAAPKVYDRAREVMIFNQDGSTEMKTLHEVVRDKQTGEMIELNDLAGSYTVNCSMGPMFRNRAEKANTALLELGGVMPEVLQGSADIFVNNIPAPGMDAVAERVRKQLFESGVIPPDQWTEEEAEIMQARQAEPPQPDPAMLLAQAEMMKAQADMLAEQNKQAELQVKAITAQDKIRQTSIKEAEALADINNTNADTGKKIAETEKINGDTATQMLDNIQKITPDFS